LFINKSKEIIILWQIKVYIALWKRKKISLDWETKGGRLSIYF
jgi:hypothetical protein